MRAAEIIVIHAGKAIEIEDIEARVAALEAAAPTTPQRARCIGDHGSSY